MFYFWDCIFKSNTIINFDNNCLFVGRIQNPKFHSFCRERYNKLNSILFVLLGYFMKNSKQGFKYLFLQFCVDICLSGKTEICAVFQKLRYCILWYVMLLFMYVNGKNTFFMGNYNIWVQYCAWFWVSFCDFFVCFMELDVSLCLCSVCVWRGEGSWCLNVGKMDLNVCCGICSDLWWFMCFLCIFVCLCLRQGGEVFEWEKSCIWSKICLRGERIYLHVKRMTMHWQKKKLLSRFVSQTFRFVFVNCVEFGCDIA